ncbi:MAG: hypothetical protein OXF74_05970 [Rhodobacteraceae bacterium]|nr:hypothetical protein [Paracoccaceae bacterium]
MARVLELSTAEARFTSLRLKSLNFFRNRLNRFEQSQKKQYVMGGKNLFPEDWNQQLLVKKLIDRGSVGHFFPTFFHRLRENCEYPVILLSALRRRTHAESGYVLN